MVVLRLLILRLNYGYFLITLIRLEFIVMTIGINLYFLIRYININELLLIYFLVLRVCERVLGLVILVSIIRFYSIDIIKLNRLIY